MWRFVAGFVVLVVILKDYGSITLKDVRVLDP
jgi:hypothetical protein